MALTLTHSPDHEQDGTNAPRPPAPLTSAEVIAYLNYQLEPLLRQRDTEVLPALRTMAKTTFIAIDDTETDAVFTQNRKTAKDLIRAATGAKKTEERPFVDAGNALRGWFARFEAPITAALKPIEQVMLDLGERRQAAATARAAEEARKRQEAADLIAAEAARAIKAKPAEAEQLLAQSEAAAEEARRALAAAAARPAANTRVRGIYGAVSSVRTTWTHEVTDFDAVPREYLMVDKAKVAIAMKDRDRNSNKPTAVIPGITWIAQRAIGG
jgi:O-acetyl-ADP-ribose deacetylase (regulator of RNase III)